MNSRFIQEYRRDKYSAFAASIEDDLEDVSQQASMLLDTITAIAQGVQPDEGNTVYRDMVKQFPATKHANLTVEAYVDASQFIIAQLSDLGRTLTRLSFEAEETLLGR